MRTTQLQESMRLNELQRENMRAAVRESMMGRGRAARASGGTSIESKRSSGGNAWDGAKRWVGRQSQRWSGDNEGRGGRPPRGGGGGRKADLTKSRSFDDLSEAHSEGHQSTTSGHLGDMVY